MKKINYFVMLGLSATLILASCSQQRYANRARVHVNDQAKEQVKQEQKEVASIAPKPAEAIKPELKQAEDAKTVQAEKITPKPREVFKQLTSKESITFLREAAKDPKQIKDLVVKPDNQTKRDFKSETGMETGRWLTWIIVGLILVLLGLIIPWTLGWLLYAVGSVLIVIGIIFLLLELLGA
ncbi:MAG: hypothetical protein ACYC1Q_09265 [Bacteroidia bacterium]